VQRYFQDVRERSGAKLSVSKQTICAEIVRFALHYSFQGGFRVRYGNASSDTPQLVLPMTRELRIYLDAGGLRI